MTVHPLPTHKLSSPLFTHTLLQKNKVGAEGKRKPRLCSHHGSSQLGTGHNIPPGSRAQELREQRSSARPVLHQVSCGLGTEQRGPTTRPPEASSATDVDDSQNPLCAPSGAAGSTGPGLFIKLGDPQGNAVGVGWGSRSLPHGFSPPREARAWIPDGRRGLTESLRSI